MLNIYNLNSYLSLLLLYVRLPYFLYVCIAEGRGASRIEKVYFCSNLIYQETNSYIGMIGFKLRDEL